MRKTKLVFIVIIMIGSLFILTGCEYEKTDTQKDKEATIKVGNELTKNQPTPTDIDYSLERYNLIKRTYWVNGQREKANTLICEIEKPLGYIVLFTESGAVINQFIVDGKVSSLNSFLTPDSEFYEKDMQYKSGNTDIDTTFAEKYSNKWLPDVDGSYGENDKGIFFFTTDGKYIEWTGILQVKGE